MTQFQDEVQHRVDVARESLEQARAQGDDYLVEVRVGELQSLVRIAEENDVDIPGLTVDDPVELLGPTA